MKRIFAIVLATVLILALLPVNAEQETESFELASFHDAALSAVISKPNKVTASTKHTYDGALYSMEIPFGGEVRMALQEADFRNYDNIVFTIYSENIGSKWNAVFFHKDPAVWSEVSGKYSQLEATITSFGWQEIVIPVSRLKTVLSHATNGVVSHFSISMSGWNIQEGQGWQTGDIMWIDSIRLEKDSAKATTLLPTNGADDSVLLGLEYTMRSQITINNASSETLNSRPGGNAMRAMFTVNGKTATSDMGRSWKLQSNETPVGLLDYEYINFWLYSPKPQKGTVLLQIETGGKNAAGKNSYILYILGNMDWTGYKLVSIPLSSGQFTNFDTKPADKKVAQYKTVYLAVNNWLDNNTYAYSGDTKTNLHCSAANGAMWLENGSFGIEKFWFSKNQPDGANAFETPAASIALAGAENDIVLADFSQPPADNCGNITVNYGAGRLYNQNAQSKTFQNAYVKQETNYNWITGGANGAAEAIFYTTTALPNDAPTIADKANALKVSDNRYLNLWMYNPSVSYDQFGNYSEYVLACEVFDNNDTNDIKTTYRHAGIIANWKGWKLISIPVSALGDWENGIVRMKITSNEWKSGGKSSPSGLTKTLTETQCETGYETGGSYNTFANKGNYFFMERVWISTAVPETRFDTYSKSISYNNNVIDTVLNFDNIIDANYRSVVQNGIQVVKNGETVNNALISVEDSQIRVQISDNLEAIAAYSIVLPDNLVDQFGNLFSGSHKIVLSADDVKLIADGFTYTVANGEATITGIDSDYLPAAQQAVITLPESAGGYPVTEIQNNAFEKNKNIRKAVLPAHLKTIGARAFSECSNLSDVEMNTGLETIKTYAFYASGITKFVAPSTLKIVEAEAFRICNKLTRIILSPSINNLATHAFYRCMSIKEIYFPEEIPDSAYGDDLVGGFAEFQTVTAFGKANSYIETLAEMAVDSASNQKQYCFSEVIGDVIVFEERLVDEGGSELKGTNRDIKYCDGTIGYEAEWYNTSEQSVNVNLLMVLYDNNNRLTMVNVGKIEIPAKQSWHAAASDLKLEGVTLADGYTVKVIALNSYEELMPIKIPLVCRFDENHKAYKVMAIGNSFSQDSIIYLKQIAAADGVVIEPYNCYIGGCTLERHYNNWKSDSNDYTIQKDGAESNNHTTIRDMLQMEQWDMVVQQATTHATAYDSYLWENNTTAWQTMTEAVSEQVPKARRLVHMTWAPYTDNAKVFHNGEFAAGTPNARTAYTNALVPHYAFGANIYSTTKGEMIPTAIAVDYAITNLGFVETEGTKDENGRFNPPMGTNSIYRDTTCHLSSTGRVLAGLVWYEIITGNDARENQYSGAGLSEEQLTKLKQAAHYACEVYQTNS